MMVTLPFAETIAEKTLVSWVSLTDLDQPGGGSALSIQFAGQGAQGFDGIVYAERVPGQWMNGSNFFQRSVPDNFGELETVTDPGEVMMAITYDLDDSITIYRDGQLYADEVDASLGVLNTYEADLSNAIIGRRHDGAGSPLAGSINEARIYNTALGADEILDIFNAGVVTSPNPPPPLPPVPQLVHQWTFDGTTEDAVGSADGELFNGASLTDDGRLALDAFQNQYFRTAPTDNTILAKTLVAWVSLNDLDDPTAGSVLTIENAEGITDTFDGIIYAERTPRQWMAGSNNFARTPIADNGGPEETVEEPGEVMVAIAYELLGNIAIYRDGQLYAEYETASPPAYLGGFADVLIGPRHEDRIDAGGPMHFFDGFINEARIYDGALSSEEIFDLFHAGPGLGDQLWAGDADQDFKFDQLDIVKVQIAGKYLTGQSATWGEGDWDGAPGGSPGNPPAGNGLFDQVDIIAALTPAHYLTGPYRAIGQSALGGNVPTSTGEIGVTRLPVPEPSTWVLFGLGLLSVATFTRRRHGEASRPNQRSPLALRRETAATAGYRPERL
jgi:hypothetical protein